MSEISINRNNYESWFMDYIDGRLDTAAVEMLMTFLDANPDLRKELDGLKEIRLEPGQVDYADKAALRKPDNDPDPSILLEHFEDYCLAAVEKQLSQREEEILQEIVEQDPEKFMTYRLYQSTILKTDPQIKYPRKSGLRKRYIELPAVRISTASIAAAVLLLLALPRVFRHSVEREIPAESGITAVEKNLNGGKEERKPDEKIAGPPAERADAQAQEQTGSQPEDKIRRMPEEPSSEKPAIKLHPAAAKERLPVFMARLDPMEAGRLALPRKFPDPQLAYRYPGTAPGGGEGEDEPADSPVINRFFKPSGELVNTLWNLAYAGIEKVNEIAEDDYSLERVVDENGHPKRVTFESPFFGISAPARNAEMPR